MKDNLPKNEPIKKWVINYPNKDKTKALFNILMLKWMIPRFSKFIFLFILFLRKYFKTRENYLSFKTHLSSLAQFIYEWQWINVCLSISSIEKSIIRETKISRMMKFKVVNLHSKSFQVLFSEWVYPYSFGNYTLLK